MSKKNVVMAFFAHHQTKTVWSTAGSLWNQKCREWPWLQEANIQIPGKACVLWSRIIPITPVTQKHGKQREKSCLLCHSWDRFIIQAKANFDKQLGTISPNLWVIPCNIQSTIEGEGSLKVMKKCATSAPLEEKKKTCWKKKCFNYN